MLLGEETKRRKISLNKSSIVGELMAVVHNAFRVSSFECIGKRCTFEQTGLIDESDQLRCKSTKKISFIFS